MKSLSLADPVFTEPFNAAALAALLEKQYIESISLPSSFLSSLPFDWDRRRSSSLYSIGDVALLPNSVRAEDRFVLVVRGALDFVFQHCTFVYNYKASSVSPLSDEVRASIIDNAFSLSGTLLVSIV
jgi:magnesium-transporting ATPase (P-type)